MMVDTPSPKLSQRVSRHPALSQLFFALWLVSLPAYCLIRLFALAPVLDAATALVALSLFLLSLSHCVENLGWPRSLAMLGAACGIALAMEYLGSAYGFVFGRYSYTNRLGPLAFGQVPVLIPVAWFMMLYPAWAVGGLFASALQLREKSGQWVRRPVGDTATGARDYHAATVLAGLARVCVAALAMTAWDLSLDPRMTADGAWVWHTAGPYFGIPLTNFVGWFVTSALIYLAWSRLDNDTLSALASVYAPADPDSSDTYPHVRDTHVLLLPILAYVLQWLGESLANGLFWGGLGVAACVFVGMGLFAGPAAYILWQHSQRTLARGPVKGHASMEQPGVLPDG